MYRKQYYRYFYCMWIASINKATHDLCVINSVMVWESTANKARKKAAEILYAPKIAGQILAHDLGVPYHKPHFPLKESAEYDTFKKRMLKND